MGLKPPEAPHKNYSLPAGPVKRVYINIEAAKRDEAAWRVWVDEDKVYVAVTWRTDHMEGLNVRGVGSRTAMLTPEGPAFWLETTAAIEIYYDAPETIHPAKTIRS
jgi:hypothetical protein